MERVPRTGWPTHQPRAFPGLVQLPPPFPRSWNPRGGIRRGFGILNLVSKSYKSGISQTASISDINTVRPRRGKAQRRGRKEGHCRIAGHSLSGKGCSRFLNAMKGRLADENEVGQTMERAPPQRLASPCEVLHIAPPLVARPGKPPLQRLTAGETALSPTSQGQR